MTDSQTKDNVVLETTLTVERKEFNDERTGRIVPFLQYSFQLAGDTFYLRAKDEDKKLLKHLLIDEVSNG